MPGLLQRVRKHTVKKRPASQAEPPPAIVNEINALADTWKRRLGVWQKPRQGQPLTLASDCSGYGSELIALRLLGLQHRFRPVMACDNSAAKRKLHETTVSTCGFDSTQCQYFDDIFLRDNARAPRADLYCAGYPCPSFSRLGKRKGHKDKRGLATLHGLEYAASCRPRALLLEQVSSILDKNHTQLWNFVLKILSKLDYTFVHGVVNTRSFGIPQSRPRVYLMAICSESVVQSLAMPSPRADQPDLHTFLQKDLKGTEKLSLPFYEKELGKSLWTHGYVLDVESSETFQSVLRNCAPCLTKTRCKQSGYYIPKLLRRLTGHEMGKLQGLPQPVMEALMAAGRDLSKGAFQEAVGDAMSINVLQTMLRRLLRSSGLTKLDSDKDFWLLCPANRCHQLSDNLYQKYK